MSIVLVVEDDATAAQVIELTLELDGHVVCRAREVREALDALRLRSFDLVLLDLSLPDGHGFDVLHAIRDAGDTPVLVVSGQHGAECAARAFRLGADDYQTKPFSPLELSARAGRLLRPRAAGVA